MQISFSSCFLHDLTLADTLADRKLVILSNYIAAYNMFNSWLWYII